MYFCRRGCEERLLITRSVCSGLYHNALFLTLMCSPCLLNIKGVWRNSLPYTNNTFALLYSVRAEEQEKLDDLNLNSTVTQTGRNVTQELDKVFYLGIYGGQL